jgi:tRNA-Thr(GGU) m(6)t(6)A37 methyltransferase TsaA
MISAERNKRDIMKFVMHPIGVIHSPFTDKAHTPIQPSRSKAIGTVELFSDFVDGLRDVDGFSHLILLYVFHRSSGYELSVKPFLDNQLRGLFATRHPCRPNPLGMSIVRLLNCQDNVLEIEGVDVLDNTPLLDIKPYVPDFDERSGVRAGWYDFRSNLDDITYPPN